jgi:hypothetical protein
LCDGVYLHNRGREYYLKIMPKKKVAVKAEEVIAVEKTVEAPKKVENSTINGEFIYETNGIKYKKIFKDGVIVERVRI